MRTDQKQDAIRVYSPLWFVRMPFKGMKPQWIGPGRNKQPGWDGCIRILDLVDTDRDHQISVQELDNYVHNDGIDVRQYREQITSRDRCKAAAFGTWMLRFNKTRYEIALPEGWRLGDPVPEWEFAECL